MEGSGRVFFFCSAFKLSREKLGNFWWIWDVLIESDVDRALTLGNFCFAGEGNFSPRCLKLILFEVRFIGTFLKSLNRNRNKLIFIMRTSLPFWQFFWNCLSKSIITMDQTLQNFSKIIRPNSYILKNSWSQSLLHKFFDILNDENLFLHSEMTK